MYKEIFSKNQLELLPFIKSLKSEFYLVGGNAIAFHIGHRRSIGFNLFKYNQLNHRNIIKKIITLNYKY